MKKSKLIKLLTELKGDPHVFLWNGLVSDWVDIDPKFIVDQKQKKLKYNEYFKIVVYENQKKDPTYQLTDNEIAKIKKNYIKYCDWEVGYESPFEDHEVDTRKVAYINSKTKGKIFKKLHCEIKY
jgi:hypothetical protein